MPKIVEYKKDAIVYFEGDKADKIFVLQSGHVNLISTNLEGERVHDVVGTGEFFGVRSTIGNYAREEMAKVVQDAKIMTFTVAEFEALCSANPRIVMKMLKVFSNQLRKINKQLSTLIKQDEADPDDGLYSVGEFFIKQGKYEKAYYVISKYLEEYPSGKNVDNAKKSMSILEKMKKSGAI